MEDPKLTLEIKVIPEKQTEDGFIVLQAAPSYDAKLFTYDWTVQGGTLESDTGPEVRLILKGLRPGRYTVNLEARPVEVLPAKLNKLLKMHDELKNEYAKLAATLTAENYYFVESLQPPIAMAAPSSPQVSTADREISMAPAAASDAAGGNATSGSGTARVSLQRAEEIVTADQALWAYVRKSHRAISFTNYKKFIDASTSCLHTVPANDPDCKSHIGNPSSTTPFPFVDSYRVLKAATEVFIMACCGVAICDKDKKCVSTTINPPSAAPCPFPFCIDPDDVYEEGLRTGTSPQGIALKDKEQSLQDGLGENWASYIKPVNGKYTIPYLELIRGRLGEVPLGQAGVTDCYYIIEQKLTHPCLMELIWSYWHEEGMLVQTMNAISLRFQNRRTAVRDPLANLDLDPLRPLNNLFWGYIQDEQHRLSLVRRAYEYDHHYGLPIYGKAVPPVQGVDSRSKFLEGFHNLLYLCQIFFNQDDDTTVIADGFPVLNALKDVHILLAEGAHNQFNDLPCTARMEMLMEQWLLARPEMREFLSGKIMVPYTEPWMDRVDTVKRLEGWTDVSIMHFNHLADFGEQLLLGIRYGSWNQINHPEQAANWARYWRSEIQGYVYAYRAVTGVDLTAEVTDSQQRALRYQSPSALLVQRLAVQAAKR